MSTDSFEFLSSGTSQASHCCGVNREALKFSSWIDDSSAVDDKVIAEGEERGVGDIGAVLGSESQNDLRGDHVVDDVFAMGDGGERNIVGVEKFVGGDLKELLRGVAETVGDGSRDPEGAPFWGEVVDGDEVVRLERAGAASRGCHG